MGHMQQTRMGTRSTQPKQVAAPEPMDTIPQIGTNEKTHDVFATVINLNGKIATDQTGRFPHTSSMGSQYVMVLYAVDPNAIIAEPLKNRTSGELLRAYQKLYKYLQVRGYKPRIHKLDNEASQDMLDFIVEQQAKAQIVPPHIHRQNEAERAIQTWKHHFLSGLASVNNMFPMHHWCKLIEQANATLNMMRQCRQNIKLSAYEALQGSYNFDATPMAPPGTYAFVHEKPGKRNTWAPHASPGWYVGPALDHYRCVKVAMKSTGAVRVTDTVTYNHHATPVPIITPTDRIIRATHDLTKAINRQPITDPPSQLEAIEQLRQALSNNKLPATPATIPQQAAQPIKAHTSSAKTPVPPPKQHPVPRHTHLIPPEETAPLPTSRSPPRPPSNAHYIPPELEHPPSYYVVQPPKTIATEHQYPLRNRTHLANALVTSTNGMLLAEQYIFPYQQNESRSPYALAAAILLHQIVTNETAYSMQPAHSALQYYANAIIDEETGESLEYRDLIKNPKYKDIWLRSAADELGNLAQGVGGRVKGTGTIRFVPRAAVPNGRKITYARIVCLIRPEKTDNPFRTRITIGGDRLEYAGETATPTADLTTTKVLCNSVVSTPDAKFCTIDIAHFYLETPLDVFEYLRMHISLIPQEIIDEYGLADLVDANGFVYVQVEKGMYGLAQSGILANKLLEERLTAHGYYQSKLTPGLWRHRWRQISFALVVDDFGIKYVRQEDVDHLIAALRENYEIKIDWTGSLFCGITLDWNYVARTVRLSMPGYIEQAIHRFQHIIRKHQDSPHKHAVIQYGAKIQTVDEDNSPPILPDKIKRIQEVVGTLLYYARAVDSTMLCALSSLASAQAKGTEETLRATDQLLDYCASHPNAGIVYHASDMRLRIHSDASYLSEPQARSRAGGHFYLTNNNNDNNGAILTISTIIRHVMASAMEAEVGALFLNAREAIPLRILLEELGHPQDATEMITDNSTAHGMINKTMTPKRSKAIDMRFHWLKCREAQQQFRTMWERGSTNLADYFTKHFSPAHHRTVRGTYVTDARGVPTKYGAKKPVARLAPRRPVTRPTSYPQQ